MSLFGFIKLRLNPIALFSSFLIGGCSDQFQPDSFIGVFLFCALSFCVIRFFSAIRKISDRFSSS